MSEVYFVGARSAGVVPEKLLQSLRGLSEGEVLAMDADKVCGREHLLSAVEHAIRSFANGTNSCKDMAMETMLFASGERQISKAQEKMSPKAGARRLALVVFDAPVAEVLFRAGLKRDDALLECSRQKALALGIEKKELETVGEERAADLVLERVAFVEIAKR